MALPVYPAPVAPGGVLRGMLKTVVLKDGDRPSSMQARIGLTNVGSGFQNLLSRFSTPDRQRAYQP